MVGGASSAGLRVGIKAHLAGLVVEALLLRVEANLLDGGAHNGLVVNDGVGGDLTEHHHETSAGARLACNAGLGVLGEARIDDGVGDLVGQLVGVTLVDGLRGEEELAFGVEGHFDELGVVCGGVGAQAEFGRQPNFFQLQEERGFWRRCSATVLLLFHPYFFAWMSKTLPSRRDQGVLLEQ